MNNWFLTSWEVRFWSVAVRTLIVLKRVESCCGFLVALRVDIRYHQIFHQIPKLGGGTKRFRQKTKRRVDLLVLWFELRFMMVLLIRFSFPESESLLHSTVRFTITSYPCNHRFNPHPSHVCCVKSPNSLPLLDFEITSCSGSSGKKKHNAQHHQKWIEMVRLKIRCP